MVQLPDKSFEVFLSGVIAVRSLINYSTGVAGLLPNGELAIWADLEENWLKDFVTSEQLIFNIFTNKKER